MTLPTEVTEEQVELAFTAQEQWVKDNYPTAQVNYGWGIDYVEENIQSKIYGHGVLITDIRSLEHEFEPFS